MWYRTALLRENGTVVRWEANKTAHNRRMKTWHTDGGKLLVFSSFQPVFADMQDGASLCMTLLSSSSPQIMRNICLVKCFLFRVQIFFILIWVILFAADLKHMLGQGQLRKKTILKSTQTLLTKCFKVTETEVSTPAAQQLVT